MSYYDIDDILTDAQKVPITMLRDVPNLGYLDNNPGHTLKAGTTLSLPLWLAENLASSEATSAYFSLDIPPSLSPRVMNALKASPKSVDLRAQAQYFYSLGARILELFEEEEVCDVLVDSWRARAGEVGLLDEKDGMIPGVKSNIQLAEYLSISNLGIKNTSPDEIIQRPIPICGSTEPSSTPHCTDNKPTLPSSRGRWQATLINALNDPTIGIPGCSFRKPRAIGNIRSGKLTASAQTIARMFQISDNYSVVPMFSKCPKAACVFTNSAIAYAFSKSLSNGTNAPESTKASRSY
ncbi:hypothetical protein G7Y89_g3207 [Cudoniella acicularis]|uniref:DNA replication complex GINS protein PSF3 n=1 Tax=Cudoniella acicularis TaxID=354080 RepID=A0A8H4RT30_9HELO|nr:hypothetical protein G7Y89_g3207 [Cudoniella acicularis]